MVKRKRRKLVIYAIMVLSVCAYVFLKRVDRNPHYAQVFFNLLNNCEHSCEPDKKIQLARDTIYHDPEFSRGYTHLAYLLDQQGESEEAFNLHRKAVDLDHQNSQSLFSLGVAYFRQNDIDQAYRFLNHANLTGGWGADLNYYLGRVYERKTDFQKAKWHYLRAAQFNQQYDRAWARMGAVEFIIGDVKQALDYAEKVREIGNTDLADQLSGYINMGKKVEFLPDEG